MSQKYFTTLTHIGAALHANAQLQQTTVAWTHLVLGDGNGAEPVPSPAQTGVIREVDRLPISSIEPDPDNPSWIVIEAVIPADRGGYVVRETALMGGANGASCIAVGNYPSATKPLLSEGAGSELVIRVVVEIAHTATVTLKIDPAVVIASRDWVEKRHATQQKRGLVRLSTIQEALLGEADDIAVTPEGVMQVAAKLTADSGIVVFDTPGVHVWVAPEVLRSGMKKVEVTVEGAGGGAGGYKHGGGGGGPGGKAIKLIDLSGVNSETVTVGAGGSGVPAGTANANGGNGGTSSFGSYCSATGGKGAQNWASGGSGIGINGDVNSGNGPGMGLTPHAVNAAPNSTSTGGNGGGPNGGLASGNASITGGDPGGVASGGGGGSANGTNYGAGGAGGSGRVIIKW